MKPLDASDDDGTARAQTVDVGDNTTKKSPSSETLNIKYADARHRFQIQSIFTRNSKI